MYLYSSYVLIIGPQVDLHAGITVTMNFYKHKVTLALGSTVITELKNIRGKEIYPYVLFNQKGLYPVEIKYLEGPEGKESHYVWICLYRYVKILLQ